MPKYIIYRAYIYAGTHTHTHTHTTLSYLVLNPQF
jgi:hypothetical protein